MLTLGKESSSWGNAQILLRYHIRHTSAPLINLEVEMDGFLNRWNADQGYIVIRCTGDHLWFRTELTLNTKVTFLTRERLEKKPMFHTLKQSCESTAHQCTVRACIKLCPCWFNLEVVLQRNFPGHGSCQNLPSNLWHPSVINPCSAPLVWNSFLCSKPAIRLCYSSLGTDLDTKVISKLNYYKTI